MNNTLIYSLQCLLVFSSLGQEARLAPAVQTALVTSQDANNNASKCIQPVAQQASFIQEAEKKGYILRRLEFYGNFRTRDDLMRRSLLLNEGDVFTQRKLIRSIERLNKLKTFERVRLSDVEIQLDNEKKLIDMRICFSEK